MDFFEQQERAKRKTAQLVFYYILAVLGIIGAIYLAVSLIFFERVVWNPQLLLFTSGIVLTVIALGSLYKIIQLAQGGSAVASMLGGRPVSLQTSDAAERRLLNVVQEMAIASGVPCPEVYILDHEEAINAFAAGKTSGNAVIGVTRGCVAKLTRDELQGVIGHEFSHILNGDMRLNLRLIGLLSGILLIAMIGYWIMRILSSSNNRSSRKNSGGGAIAAIFLLGLALLLIGYIGVFFAKLIKCAISRQREFLADASSVQFTRNPAAIGGALRKIARDSGGSAVKHASAEEISHMFFSDGMSGFLSRLFSTHPPIPERLCAIEGMAPDLSQPMDDATTAIETRDEPVTSKRTPQAAIGGLSKAAVLLSPVLTATPRSRSRQVTRVLSPDGLTAQCGTPTPEHVDQAAQSIAALPQTIRDSLREPFGARVILLAMLLSPDEAIRQTQLSLIETQAEPGTAQETFRLAVPVAAIPIEFRIGVVSMLIPALRQLTPSSYTTCRKVVNALIETDGQIDLFEFTLQKILFRHLDIYFQRAPPPIPNIHSLTPVITEISILFSALANCGSGDATANRAAFARGVAVLDRLEGLRLVDNQQCGIDRIDGALNRLAHVVLPLKKQILDGCFATATADGTITVWEGELLRAVADSLDCPLPPFMETSRPAAAA